MVLAIKQQSPFHLFFYALFALVSICLMVYYLSYTLIYFTTPQQFPISSFSRFPLTFIIFPAEVFSFAFALYFVYNLMHGNYLPPTPRSLQDKQRASVAVLLPVYNEPKDIVTRTILACKKLTWQGPLRIYLLDDSSTEQDKANMAALCKKFGCTLIRRADRTGYKAGNLNHAISLIEEEYVAIFDSDQAPEPSFLEETMDYFSDPSVGFVQTPQHFINNDTPLERAATLGTNIFYHSQCISKAKDGAMPFCGTNVVVRAQAFKSVKGFSYYTSTEDIDLGLRFNDAGYHGVYVPKILVHGYAPTHYEAYASQQYRWANGNLAILRESWPKLLLGRFSMRYQIHTFFTLGWWLIGIVTLIYIVVPMFSFFIGGTHHTWLPTFLLMLLFFNVVMGLMMIFMALHLRIEGEKITPADAFLQYSLITNSMFIYVKAAFFALLKKYTGFVRTSKERASSGFGQIKWNIVLSAICFVFSIMALYKTAIASDVQQLRTYLPISVWLFFYSVILASSILFVQKIPSHASSSARLSHSTISSRRTNA